MIPFLTLIWEARGGGVASAASKKLTEGYPRARGVESTDWRSCVEPSLEVAYHSTSADGTATHADGIIISASHSPAAGGDEPCCQDDAGPTEFGAERAWGDCTRAQDF